MSLRSVADSSRGMTVIEVILASGIGLAAALAGAQVMSYMLTASAAEGAREQAEAEVDILAQQIKNYLSSSPAPATLANCSSLKYCPRANFTSTYRWATPVNIGVTTSCITGPLSLAATNMPVPVCFNQSCAGMLTTTLTVGTTPPRLFPALGGRTKVPGMAVCISQQNRDFHFTVQAYYLDGKRQLRTTGRSYAAGATTLFDGSVRYTR